MKRLVVTATALAVVCLIATVPVPAQAQSQGETSCQVTDVSAFADRVHVRCVLSEVDRRFNSRLGLPQIEYFAVANTGEFANSFATVATAARQANKPLAIIFSTDPNQNPAGCLTSDCRAAVSARLIY